jgi:hypothetical protein
MFFFFFFFGYSASYKLLICKHLGKGKWYILKDETVI